MLKIQCKHMTKHLPKPRGLCCLFTAEIVQRVISGRLFVRPIIRHHDVDIDSAARELHRVRRDGEVRRLGQRRRMRVAAAGATVLQVALECLQQARHPLLLVVARHVGAEDDEVDVETTARRCARAVRAKLDHLADPDRQALLQHRAGD